MIDLIRTSLFPPRPLRLVEGIWELKSSEASREHAGATSTEEACSSPPDP